ncbi:phospholipase D-like domain-containing protein [Halodesulfurarchaeum sp.]|uniref:phospholipase D-like domain-containing protein n=1 Tax=Halodesulfurarchaeum sp. TaxID=1980530 RepID=UPI001BC198EB|nr:phospholipase [Halodesulfurarchaeum sp.]
MFAEILLVFLLATGNAPAIDGIYPDPTTVDDRGEFVILTVPETASTGNLTLTDGEDTVDVSGVSSAGKVIITDDPGPATAVTDHPIHRVDSFLSLANAGEWIALRKGNRTIENVSYSRSSEGELYRNGRFVPPGRSDFPPMSSRNVTVRTFLLPDQPKPITELFDTSRNRIRLAGYTFTDPAVTDALIQAHRRNVSVSVLVEGGPVGGITEPQVEQLDRLRAAGISVTVLGTDRARYQYQHAKYAIVDDRALVTSENWKPGSIGGNGSRGWAAEIHDPAVAQNLSRIFAADRGFVDTSPWVTARPSDPVSDKPDTESYPSRFSPTTSTAESVTVFVAPDNAAAGVTSMLESATDSIRIQQVSIDPSGRLLNATIGAAERGIDVRILLSGAWYVESENRALAKTLRRRADREGLPIKVRLAEPRSRYEHVHAKGLIVDGESTLVGSLNWNAHALNENREVAVQIDDPETAAAFERAFIADWRGAAWRVPWGTIVGAAVLLVFGVGYANRMATFETG